MITNKTLTKELLLTKTKVNSLSEIKVISFFGCDLENIDIISKLNNLEICTLSGNKISSLKPFSYCKTLKELYIRRNNIINIKEILYLKQCKNLKILWIDDNPFINKNNYRDYIINQLPTLQKLDNKTIINEEKKLIIKTRQNTKSPIHAINKTPIKFKKDINYTTASSTFGMSTIDSNSFKTNTKYNNINSNNNSNKKQCNTKQKVINVERSIANSPVGKKYKSFMIDLNSDRSFRYNSRVNTESSCSNTFRIVDSKKPIMNAIVNLISVLGSPELKRVKNIIENKLN
jgi:hypothetical protein